MNETAEDRQVAYAFPELRCTFGGRSIIPDITVLKWDHIEFDESGERIDDVLIAPDWAIEILSLDQSSNRVTGNILHCLTYGCQLGWIVDPDDAQFSFFNPINNPDYFKIKMS